MSINNHWLIEATESELYSYKAGIFVSRTDCVFSPHEQVIMTGTSMRKGQVHMYSCVALCRTQNNLATSWYALVISRLNAIQT